MSRGGGLSPKHEALGEKLSLLLQHFSITHGIPWHHFNTHTYDKHIDITLPWMYWCGHSRGKASGGGEVKPTGPVMAQVEVNGEGRG